MIADRARVAAYTQALRAAVRPGAVVVDIGTGTGMMAVQACQFGASRVYAIESGEVIQVAREVAAANGCADRIEFFEDISTRVTIPVRADVVVSDLRGALPLFEKHIPSIADARARFLGPAGTLIGRRDRIWAAVVDAPKAYGKIVDSWNFDGHGLNFAAARQKVLNQFHNARVTPEQLLTAPKLWTTLDFASVTDPDVRGPLHFTIERNGVGHGILMWFDTELADGAGFSTGPEVPETVYGAAFFAWLEPVRLLAGQNLCVELEAKLLKDDYLWRWTAQIESAEKSGEPPVRFTQSLLHGTVLSPAKLRKSASDFVPKLTREGLDVRRVLELMDTRTSLEGIARRLAAEFPERFEHWHKALSFVGTISQEYSG